MIFGEIGRVPISVCFWLIQKQALSQSSEHLLAWNYQTCQFLQFLQKERKVVFFGVFGKQARAGVQKCVFTSPRVKTQHVIFTNLTGPKKEGENSKSRFGNSRRFRRLNVVKIIWILFFVFVFFAWQICRNRPGIFVFWTRNNSGFAFFTPALQLQKLLAGVSGFWGAGWFWTFFVNRPYTS